MVEIWWIYIYIHVILHNIFFDESVKNELAVVDSTINALG